MDNNSTVCGIYMKRSVKFGIKQSKNRLKVAEHWLTKAKISGSSDELIFFSKKKALIAAILHYQSPLGRKRFVTLKETQFIYLIVK